MRHLLLLISLFTLISSCNPFQPDRKPAQVYSYTDESIIKFKIPMSLVKREIELVANSSDMIKKINYLNMDPVTRILTVNLDVKFPLETLITGWGIEPPKYHKEVQNIELAVSFPKAKSLAYTRYLSLTFHRFEINGADYLNAFPTVANVINTFIVNTDLLNYVYDQTSSVIPQGDTGEYYRNLMAEVLENNGIRINPTMKTMSFKLNLKYFDQFSEYTRFKEYQDLRLWQFSPFLLKGTKEVFFHLEAGLGKPSKVWLDEYDQRVAEDNRSILEIREGLYREFSDINSVKIILNNYLDSLLARESIQESKLSLIYKNDLRDFRNSTVSNAKKILNLSNENFKADPENEYIVFIEDEKSRIKNYVIDLDRRLSIDSHILAGGSSNNNKPMFTTRIGLDAINAAMNFARDYTYDGQNYVKEAYVAIAPQVPGLVIKGKVNIDLNYILSYMEKGLLDSKLNSKIQETKEGVPFEMVIEVKSGDDSWLALDAKSISLMEGEKKLVFKRTNKTNKFFLDFIKLYVVQSMAAVEYDIGGESDLTPEMREAQKLKELLTYFKALKSNYSEVKDQGILMNIKTAMETDLAKNPFAAAGEDFLKNKEKILFSDIFFFDEKDKLFKIRLDPRIVIDNILGANNNLQIWNASPLFSKEFNNTFLELTVGAGKRSKNYIQSLHRRENNLDNANFVGLYQDNNRSSADLLVSLDFNYLESYVNKLFQEIIVVENKRFEKELEKDEEQTQYLLENIKLDITDQNRIFLDLNASVVKKKKTWFGLGKWKVDKSSYGLQAELSLAAKDLKNIEHLLKKHQSPIYYTNQLIAVGINKVRVKFGKPSLINTALNKLTNLNLDTPIGTKFRSLLLTIVNKYFSSQWKDKDQKLLYGHSIEEMARVFTTNTEIMLMLNPRVSGAAFDLQLTGRDNFVKEAIVIDKSEQQLHMAFTTAISIAKIDKRELVNFVQDTNDLLNPYLEINNKSKFLKALQDLDLVNKAVLNSDDSKLSLYNRLIRLMRHYDQVLNTVNIPFKAKNIDQRITANATELMYFSAAGYLLYNRLYKVTKKIQDYKLTGKVKYYKTLVEAKNKLYQNIFKPLMFKYREDYHQRNRDILNAPYSYWTKNFYADAYFSEIVYKELLKEGI